MDCIYAAYSVRKTFLFEVANLNGMSLIFILNAALSVNKKTLYLEVIALNRNTLILIKNAAHSVKYYELVVVQ